MTNKYEFYILYIVVTNCAWVRLSSCIHAFVTVSCPCGQCKTLHIQWKARLFDLFCEYILTVNIRWLTVSHFEPAPSLYYHTCWCLPSRYTPVILEWDGRCSFAPSKVWRNGKYTFVVLCFRLSILPGVTQNCTMHDSDSKTTYTLHVCLSAEGQQMRLVTLVGPSLLKGSLENINCANHVESVEQYKNIIMKELVVKLDCGLDFGLPDFGLDCGLLP